MSCELAHSVLHGYLDGELDAVRAAEFERHLESCAECASALKAQESLRASLKDAGIYERAPVSLRRKIRAELQSGAGRIAAPQRIQWRWLAAAAGIALIALAAWRLPLALRRSSGDAALPAEIVDAHLRSLQPGHLTDVASTDQHTVKPWFNGKVDFAPPVRDFSAEGFPLVGGRLDVIRGHTVATLVYGRRKHFVNVFLWPSTETDLGPQSGSLRGYGWMRWRSGGMEYWIVSDAAPADLETLRQLLVR